MSSGATRRTTRSATKRTTRTGGRGGGMASTKAFLIAVLFLVGVGSAFLMIQKNKDLEEIKKRDAQLKATITVVGAARDLSKDYEITPADLAMIQIPASSGSTFSYFSSLSDPGLTSKILVSDVSVGKPVLREFLKTKEQIKRENKEPLGAGEVEVTVPIAPQEIDLFYIKKGGSVGIYSSLVTPSGNRMNRLITKQARILLVNKAQRRTSPTGKEEIEGQDEVILAVRPEESKLMIQDMQDRKVIRIQEPGIDAPPSTAAIIQVWTGVEVEEKEVPSSIGSTLAYGGGENEDMSASPTSTSAPKN